MQPKTPAPTFSIILMRDDCDVNAFRLHSLWIKLFIVSLFFLVAACIVGAYGTFYYKNRYEVTAADRRELQRTLGENKIKLESLANEELVGRFTGTGPGPATAGASVVASPSNGNGVQSEVAGGNPPSTASMPTHQDLANLLGQLDPVPASAAAAPVDEEMEKHPVKVGNLKASFESEDRIHVTWDLSNQQPGLTLIGRCTVGLVLRDGSVVDVTPSTRGVLSFQIARFRKMDIVSQIPASIPRSDIVRVQISAQANDLPLYYKQFPLTES